MNRSSNPYLRKIKQYLNVAYDIYQMPVEEVEGDYSPTPLRRIVIEKSVSLTQGKALQQIELSRIAKLTEKPTNKRIYCVIATDSHGNIYFKVDKDDVKEIKDNSANHK